jgi:hypothetical protein
MTIKEHWNEFDPATRQWLIDNPGCLLIPRTIAAAMDHASEEPTQVDIHGQLQLSEEDIDFIRTRSHTAAANHGIDHFYDATQPGNSHNTPPGTGR